MRAHRDRPKSNLDAHALFAARAATALLALQLGCAEATQASEGSGSAQAGTTASVGVGQSAGASSVNPPATTNGVAGAGSSASGSGGRGAGGAGPGTTPAGGTGGNVSGLNAVGTAVMTVTQISLLSCTATASAALLEATDDGLMSPKPTQSLTDGTFRIDFTVPGQYGQAGIDFDPPVDMTGCELQVTLLKTAGPECGVYAVPFFYDPAIGLVAPYDLQAKRFMAEQVTSSAPTTMSLAPTGTKLPAVSRIGINVYDCAQSVTVTNF